FGNGCTIVGDSWFGSPKLCLLLIENGLYIAVVNSTHLIVASLKDQKPQCIIAIASTTTQGDEVEHIVKKHNNSSLVKFA
ncbi:15714_t:CDS:2, partial [Gigaspora margarita]